MQDNQTTASATQMINLQTKHMMRQMDTYLKPLPMLAGSHDSKTSDFSTVRKRLKKEIKKH